MMAVDEDVYIPNRRDRRDLALLGFLLSLAASDWSILASHQRREAEIYSKLSDINKRDPSE